MQVVDKLPASLLGNLHHIQGFVASFIAPSVTFSAAKLGVSDSLDEQTCQKTFGQSKEVRREVVRLQGLWQRGEDTRCVISSFCFLVGGFDSDEMFFVLWFLANDSGRD